jgi:hypothetical protein
MHPVEVNPGQTPTEENKENPDLLDQEQNPDGANLLNVHPIPVRQGADLVLTYETKTGKNLVVEIISAQGKTVSSVTRQLLPGKNEFTLKTDTLTPGTYIVKTIAGDKSQTKTIIVQ